MLTLFICLSDPPVAAGRTSCTGDAVGGVENNTCSMSVGTLSLTLEYSNVSHTSQNIHIRHLPQAAHGRRSLHKWLNLQPNFVQRTDS